MTNNNFYDEEIIVLEKIRQLIKAILIDMKKLEQIGIYHIRCLKISCMVIQLEIPLVVAKDYGTDRPSLPATLVDTRRVP